MKLRMPAMNAPFLPMDSIMCLIDMLFSRNMIAMHAALNAYT